MKKLLVSLTIAASLAVTADNSAISFLVTETQYTETSEEVSNLNANGFIGLFERENESL